MKNEQSQPKQMHLVPDQMIERYQKQVQQLRAKVTRPAGEPTEANTINEENEAALTKFQSDLMTELAKANITDHNTIQEVVQRIFNPNAS